MPTLAYGQAADGRQGGTQRVVSCCLADWWFAVGKLILQILIYKSVFTTHLFIKVLVSVDDGE